MARRVTDIDELLARATERGPYVASDGKTGSSLERLVVDGERYVVKWVHVDDDWAMRGYGDWRPGRGSSTTTGCSTWSPTASTTPSSPRRRGAGTTGARCS